MQTPEALSVSAREHPLHLGYENSSKIMRSRWERMLKHLLRSSHGGTEKVWVIENEEMNSVQASGGRQVLPAGCKGAFLLAGTRNTKSSLEVRTLLDLTNKTNVKRGLYWQLQFSLHSLPFSTSSFYVSLTLSLSLILWAKLRESRELSAKNEEYEGQQARSGTANKMKV